jgi:hypothetical protein
MGRFIAAGALISAALGFAFALPVAAQAASSAPTSGIVRMAVSSGHHAAPNLAPGGQWEFSGLTYPDTSAGLAACNTEGRYLITTYHNTDQTYNCEPAYQLWIYFDGSGF